MAALRQPREPIAPHVSRTEGGEATLLRRYSALRRRVPAISRRLRTAGRQGATEQSGLAYSQRRSAQCRQSGAVRDVAVTGHGLECGECRYVVGFYWPLPAGRDQTDPSTSRGFG